MPSAHFFQKKCCNIEKMRKHRSSMQHITEVKQCFDHFLRIFWEKEEVLRKLSATAVGKTQLVLFCGNVRRWKSFRTTHLPPVLGQKFLLPKNRL